MPDLTTSAEADIAQPHHRAWWQRIGEWDDE
jgi:hypothetical protein